MRETNKSCTEQVSQSSQTDKSHPQSHLCAAAPLCVVPINSPVCGAPVCRPGDAVSSFCACLGRVSSVGGDGRFSSPRPRDSSTGGCG